MRLTLLLPPRLLVAGRYEAGIVLWVFPGGKREVVTAGEALTFEVYEDQIEGGEDDEIYDDDALVGDPERLEESRTVDRPLLEWIVEPIIDDGAEHAA